MKDLNCAFCTKTFDDIIAENAHALAFYDHHPVNKGHAIIIPKRHFISLFDAREEEIIAMYRLIHYVQLKLDHEFKPDGYNIGINIGETAGQSVMHLHIHLIPRYKGDVESPRGGIRNFKKPLVEY